MKGTSMRMIRTYLNLSLAELGQLTGYSAGYLQHVERGKYIMTNAVQTKVTEAFKQNGLTEEQLEKLFDFFERGLESNV